MYVPSRRRCSFRVRTITAFTTLPFCTWPSGAASFTAAVIMSPRLAFSPVEPPSGRIICSLRAPELSATSNIDLIITAMAIPPISRSRSVAGNARYFDRGFGHQRRFAHNVFQLPALQFGQRTRLLQSHDIAYVCLVGFVMRIELLIPRDHAPVKRM